MTPSEYLDAAKRKIGTESDYELSKKLEVNSGWVSTWRKGDRGIPLHIAFKLAITLELDPATVVADLESQREKNEKRKAFWASFTSRARAASVLIACTLALSFSGIYADAGKAPGGAEALAMAASAAFLLRRKFA